MSNAVRWRESAMIGMSNAVRRRESAMSTA